MATNFLKKDKAVVVELAAKAVFPFVINTKIVSGQNGNAEKFFLLGRIIRPVEKNKRVNMDLVIQSQVGVGLSQSNLLIKYEAVLQGGVEQQDNSTTLVREPGFFSYDTFNINFNNSLENDKMLVSVYAINLQTITVPNYNSVNLVYLERKEE